MNREIKFRAWDKDLKRFVYFDLKDVFEGGIGYGDYGDFEINQFTGLKDKNGKEIYEGDIVEYYEESGLNTGDGKSVITQVVYCNDHGGYEIETKHYGSFSISLADSCIETEHGITVIGNIYQDKHYKVAQVSRKN